MIGRRGVIAGALGLAGGLSGIGAAAAPARGKRAPADLTGVWTNSSYTPLERPKEFSRLVVTPKEAEAWEAPRRALGGRLQSPTTEIGQSESEFIEMGAGLMRVRGEIRSSLIVDPADGKVPVRPDLLAQIKATAGKRFDHPEERPAFERCLASSGSGAPIVPAMDANLTHIVQTGDAVLIVSEKLGEARVVHLGGRPRGPQVPSWTGTSHGRWEGATLHVETTGLRPGLTDRFFFFLSDRSRVTERFVRSGPDELHYAFTVDDPVVCTQPWSGELVFTRTAGRMFEYACHEGNYGLPGILGGARREEAEGRR
jgi:hypothetical protein